MTGFTLSRYPTFFRRELRPLLVDPCYVCPLVLALSGGDPLKSGSAIVTFFVLLP